jgi:sugar O-acyltransferase (sialic acid O-acetyltransferase NeuD family)
MQIRPAHGRTIVPRVLSEHDLPPRKPPDVSAAGPDSTPLLIVGAGGFARETAAAVHSINAVAPTWDLLGFLDDDPALLGREFEGAEVLGPVDAGVAAHPDASVVVCTGNPQNYFSRPAIVRRLRLAPDRYATVIHPAASMAPTASIGHGTVILAGAVATAQCRIGNHVVVMPMVAIIHDDLIGDFATLASGVRLGGGARVELGAYLGAGAIVRERVTVGAWSLVAMGAVVTRSVPRAQVWAGVPAKCRRAVDLPAEVADLPPMSMSERP